MNVIEALEEEVIGLGESIEKRKRLYPSVQIKEEIISLSVLQMNTEKLLSELKEGIDLRMTCVCGFTSAACNFVFGIDLQSCEHCGNHVRVSVICPECGKERVVYQDRRFEGD